MSTLTMLTRSGTSRSIPVARVAALREGLRGTLLLPADSQYDETRSIWNGMIQRRPAMIVRCQGAADVVRAVDFGREHDLLIAVRGGGHNVAGNAVCDGGLVIDLSPMKAVRVDASRRTARVEAGCLLRDVDCETQAFGLAVPAGIVSSTGVAGLTLGGGFGWLSRKHGLTVDNLLSADVVTVDGKIRVASPNGDPDLFWAVRGGGGNFGVVTSFEFRLHAVGPSVYSGLVVHPFDRAKEYIRFHRELVARAPDELTVWMVLRRAPPLPFLPPSVHGQLVVAVPFVYLGAAKDGEALTRPLRTFGQPHGEAVGMNPFVSWQSGFDGLNAAGARNYWKSHCLGDFSDGAIDVVLQHCDTFPSPDCEVFIPHMQGAVARVPPEESAYAHRAAAFVLNIHTRWQDASRDREMIGWARAFFEALRPHATGGVYVNFLSDEGEERVHDAYPEGVWNRLVAIKRKYDPDNVFRLNQNIKP